MTHYYHCYGLNLESDVDLWPLPPENALDKITSASNEEAVVIACGSVSNSGFCDNTTGLSHCHAMPDAVWLNIPNVARFLIEGGRKIAYEIARNEEHDSQYCKAYNKEPSTKSDAAKILELALFIQSHCIAYILTQRNYLVLRASAVRAGNKAVLFAGQTHTGKSTYAAALHHRHFDVICDDVCVIDNNNRVLPGYPYLKIWADIVRYLKYDLTHFKPLRPLVDKYFYPLGKGFCNTPLPVGDIYMINKSQAGRWSTNAITGLNKHHRIEGVVYRPAVRQALQLSPLAPKILKLVASTNMVNATWPDPIRITNYKPRIAHQLQFFLDHSNKA